MAGLLSRLGKATGDALQVYGSETLKVAKSSLDQKRLERLEEIKRGYAVKRLERQGELGVEAATALHERGLEDIELTGELSAEAATVKGIAQTERDEQLHQYKKTEKTFELEEKARIEGGWSAELLTDARIKKLSETIFDDAYDLPWTAKEGFTLDRWKGSVSRVKADIRDRLKSGWTEIQVYDYLVDNKIPEEVQSTSSVSGGSDVSLDRIMREQKRPGVTNKDILSSILNEPRLSHLHEEARLRLDN